MSPALLHNAYSSLLAHAVIIVVLWYWSTIGNSMQDLSHPHCNMLYVLMMSTSMISLCYYL